MITKRKSKVIICLACIILGITFISLKYLIQNYKLKQDDDLVELFFENVSSEETEVLEEIELIEEKEEVKQEVSYNYIAVLEIPSINFKRGIASKYSYANNIDLNIKILNESDMPDVVNGNVIIAGHSGTSYKAFFRNLYKVNIGDEIFIYYNNVKYKYIVVNYYEELKDGDISIRRNKNKSTLTLTTCSMTNKSNQIVVIAELESEELI